MDLRLSDEQRELVASFANLLAKASSPVHVRDAEPLGFDADLWQTLSATGVVHMAVSEDAGGWGASLVDLVLVAEQLGRTSASAPVIESQVAARLLAAVGSQASTDALERSLDSSVVTSLAVRVTDGRIARLAPAGAICGALVLFDGNALRLADVSDRLRSRVENLASSPLADVCIESSTDLVAGSRASDLYERAVDEWMVLTAAAVVGAGSAAWSNACGYATERRAFGAAIRSFQGVSHPLADDATSLDGAQLLVRKAAWELDRGGPLGRELASMAFAFASRVAEKATYDALHTHGGYGFMLEYDVQLHWRRVRGWARVWGDHDAAMRRAADARYPKER